MSIRARMIVAVVAVAAAAVFAFATLSIIAIDRTLRSTMDARLLTTATAIGAAIDVHHNRPDPDAGDRAQIAALRRDTHAAILDANGALVDGTRPPTVPLNDRTPHLTMVGAGEEARRVAVVPIVRHRQDVGWVVAWRSMDLIYDADRAMLLAAVVFGMVVIGLGALLARAVADRIVAPLNRIAALAEGIEAKDLSSRLNANGSDELARLASSFDRMLGRLQSAFEMERRFTADASHELRAPLAVLRAETELALRRTRTDDEYRAALRSIANEVERLESLINDLLVAARAEIDSAEGRSIDVRELVDSVVERAAPPATMKGVALGSDGAQAFAIAERNGIERALLGIVHNAIVFAPSEVHLRVEQMPENVAISVMDDGPGFSSEALQHATERFWRADGARPRGGTGLGLAIARTIVEANGGRLTLANNNGGGARVTILLRKAP